MENQINTWAKELWGYHLMNHQLVKADAILVLCSHDKRVAERGAQLFLDGWAPFLIFSGGFGAITKAIWNEPEADQFARVALGMGVPQEKIIVENRSSNTGENVLFTKQLLLEKGLAANSFILVQKPYMERRSYATFRQLWPEKEIVVTSPQVTFDEYLKNYSNETLSKDEVISIIVGDLQRLRLYPARGFQIRQEIPDEIWSAYEQLVKAGYDKHLVPHSSNQMDELKSGFER
jgi:uncharacterized SAM-binding protein YcdF (DUF218 family)